MMGGDGGGTDLIPRVASSLLMSKHSATWIVSGWRGGKVRFRIERGEFWSGGRDRARDERPRRRPLVLTGRPGRERCRKWKPIARPKRARWHPTRTFHR